MGGAAGQRGQPAGTGPGTGSRQLFHRRTTFLSRGVCKESPSRPPPMREGTARALRESFAYPRKRLHSLNHTAGPFVKAYSASEERAQRRKRLSLCLGSGGGVLLRLPAGCSSRSSSGRAATRASTLVLAHQAVELPVEHGGVPVLAALPGGRTLDDVAAVRSRSSSYSIRSGAGLSPRTRSGSADSTGGAEDAPGRSPGTPRSRCPRPRQLTTSRS